MNSVSVALFHTISTFVGYLVPKPSLLKAAVSAGVVEYRGLKKNHYHQRGFLLAVGSNPLMLEDRILVVE